MRETLPTPFPADWKPGDEITAKRLNELPRWVAATFGGIRPPWQINPEKKPAESRTVRYMVVRFVAHPDDSWVIAEPVEKNLTGGNWDGTWKPSGQMEMVSVYPNQRASDYEAFVLDPAAAPTGTANILPAFYNGREWELWQYHPFATITLPRDVLYTDCVPVSAND